MNPIFFSWRQAVVKSKLGATTKHVLMTLGCHMNEMGESCFPSIELLCEETSLSNRAVITNLKIAEEAGFIETKKHGFTGKRWARNEYKATFPPVENATNAVNKVVNLVHYLEEKAVNLTTQGSEPNDIKVVNEVHTSTSINSSIKTTPREEEKTASANLPMRPEGILACRLIKLNIAVTSIHPILCKWIADNIPNQLIDECVQLARQHKPWPEKISAGYLDAIIRNELKPKTDNSWLMSDEATIAKGREIGMQARAGESMSDYRARLKSNVINSNQQGA